MLTVGALGCLPQSKLSGFLSLYFAKGSLDIYQIKYPNDLRLFYAVEFCLQVLLDSIPITLYETTAEGSSFRQERGVLLHSLNSMPINSVDSPQDYELVRCVKNTVYNITYSNHLSVNEEIEDIMASYIYAKYMVRDNNYKDCLPQYRYYRLTTALEGPTEYEKHKHIYDEYIHQLLLSILPWILEYKIEHKESFADMEKIWEFLTEEQQDLVIFNLDILVGRKK